jgi:hypothetical protein
MQSEWGIPRSTAEKPALPFGALSQDMRFLRHALPGASPLFGPRLALHLTDRNLAVEIGKTSRHPLGVRLVSIVSIDDIVV